MALDRTQLIALAKATATASLNTSIRKPTAFYLFLKTET